MATLQFILYIGILLYSVYSAAVYLARRSGNKSQFKELQHAEPVRSLDPEEQADIQPFLVVPQSRHKKVELVSPSVYPLEGAYIRHGLQTSQGGKTEHDTLGGVDVVFPYDARDYLEEHNRAEVVLTRKFAIVVRLNGEFDLRGGRERAHEQQRQDHQWANGKVGDLAGGLVAMEEIGHENDNPDLEDPEIKDITRVRLLGQRDETPAEAGTRGSASWGWAFLLGLVAGILLLIAGHNDHPAYWYIPAGLLLLVSLWLVWRPLRIPAPQKINRVQGKLALVSLPNPSNAAVVSQQLFLGDKFALQIPPHWAEHASIPPDRNITLEMRVSDYSVVSFGRKLSIDAEEQKFPTIRWGQHLAMLIIGVLITLGAWWSSDSIRTDLAHAKSLLSPEGTQDYQDPQVLLGNLPRPGTMVHIKGSARCQIAEPAGDTPPNIDCRHLRWGGLPLQVADVQPDKELVSQATGESLQAHGNAMLDLMVQMQAVRSHDGGYNPYAPRVSLQIISNLTDFVLFVDKLCTDNKHVSTCNHLRETLGEDVLVGKQKMGSWDKLLTAAKNGDLKKDEDDNAIARKQTVSSIRDDLGALAAPRLQAFYAPSLTEALHSQQGGVILATGEDYSSPDGQNDGMIPTELSSRNWIQGWETYRRLGTEEGERALDVTGLLVASGHDKSGTPELFIDPHLNPGNVEPALARLITLAIGVLLILVHGIMFLVLLRRNKARAEAIQSYLSGNAVIA